MAGQKNALVIGAKGSIGKELVFQLRNKGYSVITLGRNSTQDITLDLENIDQYNNALGSIENLDRVYFCQGLEPSKNLKETDYDHLVKMFSIHIGYSLLILKELVPKLNESSSITFVGSLAAVKGSYDPCYAAVKAGTNALVKTLAKDLSPGITVHGISPGLIEGSTVFKSMTDDFRERHRKMNLLQEFIPVEEVVRTMILISENKYLTGKIIEIDGGFKG